MDGQLNGWMDGDGWMGGQMGRWMGGRGNGWKGTHFERARVFHCHICSLR